MNTLSVYFHYNQPTYLFWQLNWIRVFRGRPNILLLFITLGNFGLVHFILQKPSRRSIFLGPTACQASTVQYVRHPVKLIRYVHDTRCTMYEGLSSGIYVGMWTERGCADVSYCPTQGYVPSHLPRSGHRDFLIC